MRNCKPKRAAVFVGYVDVSSGCVLHATPAAGGGWRWYQVLGCKRLWGSDERRLWNDCCGLRVSLLEQGDYAARREFGVPAGIFLLALEQCCG